MQRLNREPPVRIELTTARRTEIPHGRISAPNRNLGPQLSLVQPEDGAKSGAGIATKCNARRAGSRPHAAIIAELPLDDLTVKALSRALGLSAHAVHDRYARASAGRVKLHLDREWLGRVSARIVAGERLVAVGYDAASSTQGFARKVKRLTGLTPAGLRRALAIDPALLATPCGCSRPSDCLEVGCAGRCGRVGA